MRLLLLLPLLLTGLALPLAADEAASPAEVPVDAALRKVDPWLRHEDWTVRSMVALDLRSRSDTGVVALVGRALRRETHDLTAACLLHALAGRPRADLIMEGGVPLAEGVLRWARHDHPTVRQRAFDILVQLPPIKLGKDLARYEGWWQRGRRALELEQETLLARQKTPAPAEGSSSVPTGRADDRIYEHLERIRRHGMELCIIMDHTGSMAPVIGAAKARIVSLLKRIRTFVPALRAGLVTYDDRAMLRIPLSTDDARIQKAFNRVGAAGGGDLEEGVDKGIRMALAQEVMGWSRGAQRVLVVVGDAPPHDGDVARILKELVEARDDDLYDLPVVLHTVSTPSRGTPGNVVEYFPRLAAAGGGHHVSIRDAAHLANELVLLSFGGGADRERVGRWMKEIAALRKAARK